jgi:halocyanin-like protein
MDTSQRRRRFLRVGGATLALSVAGCTDFLQEDIEFDDDVPEAVADHLSGANNVDGSITDRTGEEAVGIDVGPGGNLAYDPALAAIDSGTTVTWEWQSSGHTVTSEQTPGETEFDSSNGQEFSQTFETSGNVLYYCSPHRGAGHLGALIVE